MGDEAIFLGGGGAGYASPQQLLLRYGNRHGLIAGATGTGKTVTLQVLAEGFSRAGTPVFLSDIKGDLSGLAQAGSPDHPLHGKLQDRAAQIGLTDYRYDGFPVVFWDLFGAEGHAVRATVSEIGPLLLAQMLELNETQEGVLTIAFRLAEEEGLALLDLKDLQAMLSHVGVEAKALSLRYGNVSTATVGTIQRRILVLESQGADQFLGEPALALSDMIGTAPDGRGRINILAAGRLMQAPRLYATFLLWLLSELFEELPEIGDPDRPKFVFFFDEAHLLFDGAPKSLVDKVEQVARLIRSKGVGVYFISQAPDDIPEDILAQLGNRVQHALRAFTPRDKKALAQAAETFRPNPAFDTEAAIQAVGTGEAVVSLLEAKGTPAMVDRVLIRPPSSRLGPCEPGVRARAIAGSGLGPRYDHTIDRDSAYELLRVRGERRVAQAEAAPEPGHGRRYDPKADAPRAPTRRSDSLGEAVMKSVVRSAGSQLGRAVVKGLLRGLFR